MLSSRKITTKWYPFGMLAQNYNAKSYRFGFNGHEKDNEVYGEGNYWSFGDYGYDARISQRRTADPIIKEWESSYAVFANNPVWLVDPTGLDTVDIEYNAKKEKWEITNTQIAEGDDVFRVKIGEETKTYVFDEGEYGKRMVYLRLDQSNGEEKTENYTLGVFHLSGTNTSGFVVEPGGPSTTEKGKDRRIPTGAYDIKLENPVLSKTDSKKFTTNWPGYLLLDGYKMSGRGIRIHWSKATPRLWTIGCLVVSSDYYLKNYVIKYNWEKSRNMVKKVVSYFNEDVEYYSGEEGYVNKNEKNRVFYPSYPNGEKTIKKGIIIKSMFND